MTVQLDGPDPNAIRAAIVASLPGDTSVPLPDQQLFLPITKPFSWTAASWLERGGLAKQHGPQLFLLATTISHRQPCFFGFFPIPFARLPASAIGITTVIPQLRSLTP
jgi:hypothetical protein